MGVIPWLEKQTGILERASYLYKEDRVWYSKNEQKIKFSFLLSPNPLGFF